VRLPARFALAGFALALVVSAALSALALWTYANARTPFGYMVVGTLATAVVLAVVFVALWRKKLLR
jgi:hypothetical protein